MLSWVEHLLRLKEIVPLGVPIAVVQTCVDKQRWSWVNIFCKNRFTADYTQWIYHGEADRMRDEVVRQCINDYDVDAGIGDMLNDYHEAHFDE